jgi:hypothetical protein
MRLLFLYGPPGVGKLTVARELVALTGFKLFHNHLTIDLVTSVFPRGASAYSRLVHRFRRDMFTEAARADVDLIFTYVYAHPDDEADVRDMVAPVQANGGDVLFVQLSCRRDVLLRRVGAESRVAHGKIRDPALLAGLMDHYDLFDAVPFGESLQIDTSDTLPPDAARQIAAHYSLPTITRGKDDRPAGVSG